MTLLSGGIWPGLFAIIDRNNDPEELEYHGLSALAADHWAEIGRPVPPEVRSRRVGYVASQLEAQRLVASTCLAIDGPIVLLKGLDVAARYPESTLRRVRDVDALVSDADRVHDSLLTSGFRPIVEAGASWQPHDYDDLHELAPVECPGISMRLEVHRRPNWPSWGTPPPLDEILEAAVASTVAMDGVLAPSLEHQTLLVLAHSWSRQSFLQLCQLVDFAVLVEHCDFDVVRRTARAWGLARLLDIGRHAVDSVLLSRRPDPRVVRWLAPQLRTLAIPSPARRQFDRYAATYFVLPPLRATWCLFEGLERRVRVRLRDERVRRAVGTSR
jgi:hypothetical protein